MLLQREKNIFKDLELQTFYIYTMIHRVIKLPPTKIINTVRHLAFAC